MECLGKILVEYKRGGGGYSSLIKGLDRPLGLKEVEAPGISRHSTYEGGKIVSPSATAVFILSRTDTVY
jgi:hypothetical protein